MNVRMVISLGLLFNIPTGNVSMSGLDKSLVWAYQCWFGVAVVLLTGLLLVATV